jgi:pimeloyl-ACP methyl ester carboxylesterase
LRAASLQNAAVPAASSNRDAAVTVGYDMFRPMKVLIHTVFALMAALPVSAAQRGTDSCTPTRALSVEFNGEVLAARYLLLDARTHLERARDEKAGRLKGPVMVFFQGHAQRPSDARAFTSALALGCRSGVVVVPVSDTPYGTDKSWRGDCGKEAVLMEVVRFALARHGIGVKGHAPLSGPKARIQANPADAGGRLVEADLAALGWSHGGILARRFSHGYPESVSILGQVCPAGYEQGGPWTLIGRFIGEASRAAWRTDGGNLRDKLSSAWGFTSGFAGDFARSVAAGLRHGRPGTMRRVGRDILDCSLYSGGGDFVPEQLKRVAVIFAARDTCMSPLRILGTDASPEPAPELAARFWKRYFPGALARGAELSLQVLPGGHLAPVTHADLYARALLEALGQRAPDEVSADRGGVRP